MSSSDGGILAEGETSTSETSGDSTSPPCDLGLFERLLLTHPVWFLPGIQRAGAVHLLQGKEEGVSSFHFHYIFFLFVHSIHDSYHDIVLCVNCLRKIIFFIAY